MASPVQVVLNPENYETARDSPAGGDKQDFFANRDDDFRAHKATLVTQVLGIVAALRAQPGSDIGYVKVILRRGAWAKSHRPLQALFKRDRTRLTASFGAVTEVFRRGFGTCSKCGKQLERLTRLR
jgi:hypothetical protein